MFQDVINHPHTAIHLLLAGGYFCELVHCAFENWPDKGFTLRTVWIRIRSVRVRTIVSISGAAALGSGYALMCVAKAVSGP